MRTKLKPFISSILAVVVITLPLAGCTSNEASKDKNMPEHNVTIIQQDTMNESIIMKQPLTDKELKGAAEKYQKYLQSIADKFSEIWSGTKTENYHVIITNGETYYYVSDKNYEEIKIGSDKELKTNFQMLQYAVGMFQPVTYRGENIIAMNLMKNNEECTEEDLLWNFTILMHESFHLYQYSEWQGINGIEAIMNEQSNISASSYPLDEKPRILRAMQYDCLYQALNSKNDSDELMYLKSAKYFYEKWVNEYPEEYSSIKDTDLSEGTAEYFGNEVKRFLKDENINLTNQEEFAYQCQSADAESYCLGDIAIKLLKKRGEFKETDFENNGKTPVEILLKNINESNETDENPRLVSIVSNNIKKINSQISQNFQEYINADLKGEMAYIGVNSGSLMGVMSEGFYYLKEISKTGWQNAFISNLNIQVNGKNILEYGDNILIPVLESEISEKDGMIYNIKSDDIILNVPVQYEKRSDEKGNVIYQLIEKKE